MDNEAIRMRNKYAARLPDLQQLRSKKLIKEGDAAVKEALKKYGSLTDAEKSIVKHEGFALAPYRDSLGYPTVGIGQRVEEADIDFRDRVKMAEEDARKFVKNFDSLPQETQTALTDMAYNLGFTRLSKFTEFRKALLNNDFETAAKEMQNSKWFKQTGDRAKNLVSMVKASTPNKAELARMDQRGYEMMPDPQQFANSDNTWVRMAELGGQTLTDAGRPGVGNIEVTQAQRDEEAANWARLRDQLERETGIYRTQAPQAPVAAAEEERAWWENPLTDWMRSFR